MIHQLKTLPPYFYRILEDKKLFEVRKNDRDFQIGDEVELIYFNTEDKNEYKQPIRVEIIYVLNGGQFGIKKGYCVFGFKIIR